jgi:acyl transferase domain-containing protein/acyl carrier protein
MKARLDAIEYARREPIAIIGIGCRFPGAAGPDAYWDLLRRGADAVSDVPSSRWDVAAYFDPDPDAAGKTYTRRAGLLAQVDRFDPQFFGIAPREAVGMDPQQRLLLEVCWEAFEDAGQAPDQLHGSATGVYLGISTMDYATMQMKHDDVARLDAYSQSGLAFSIASGRVSYVLGLQGPSVSLDTACSSSLVAVHLACQALRLGECRMALAGGVHLMLLPDNSICYSRARMVAPDGKCKTFDASADGFVEGEGCGMVVLKRLSDAVTDRDRIVAVIRGSAVNQDGPSGGLTVPNGPSQEAVIREAILRAGLTPARIGYVEAHGTGTSLGDPIEVRALGAVLREGRAAGERVPIGSVKTNMGHLQSAAGVAGLIKVALSLKHGEIPAHLHFETPSPHMPWADLPVTVPTTLTPWPTSGPPRAGGVSAFGFSGTNAHVVLEEAPPIAAPSVATDRPLHVLTLSARSESALRSLAKAWAARAESADNAELPHLAFTANTGRAQFQHRLAVTAGSCRELAESLRALAEGEIPPQSSCGVVTTSDAAKVAFLFTGQGSQSAGMARQLYGSQPTFRSALDRCDELLRPLLERPLLSVLYESATDDDTINQTAYTQPVLFSVEYALAEMWRSWGVVPSAVLGHSLGEYVAACVAGVFTLEQAIELVALRAQLMQSLPSGGAMVAVIADEATVREVIASLKQAVSLAAINGPRQVVISGGAQAVASVVTALQSRDISCEPLNVSHAFHSPLMEPILDRFEDAVRRANPKMPKLLVVSNLTGKVARRELTEPSYWRRHLRETVRFADGVEALHDAGYHLLVEVGPSGTLGGMAQRAVRQVTASPSLRPGRDDWQQLSATIRELYVRGVRIDWEGFDRDYPRGRRSLPTYPFERTRYWVEDRSARRKPVLATAHPLLGPPFRTASGQVIFDSTLNTAAVPYLLDHRKHGATLLPATAYLELGLAAADELFGPGAHAFDDLVISEPLRMPNGGDVPVQVIVMPREEGSAGFEFFGRTEGGDWQKHATGTLRRQATAQDRRENLAQLRTACPTLSDATGYYAAMRNDGHEFGPSFQVIRSLWHGTNAAVARLELAPTEAAETRRYRVHPALLDGAMQLIGAALGGRQLGEGETYLPVTLERVTVYQRGATAGWGAVRLRDADVATRTLAADVQLLDDDGRVLASVDGVYLKPIHRDALAGASSFNDEWLHEIAWVDAPPVPAAVDTSQAPSNWVVFGDGFEAGTLVKTLRSRGGRCLRFVRRADLVSDADTIAVNPHDRGELSRTYRESVGQIAIRGVVYLWPLEATAEASGPHALLADNAGGPVELLAVVQAVMAEQSGEDPRLWIVSRGAQQVSSPGRAVEQAAAVALARTIAAEYPELRCTCVDLPADVTEQDVNHVLDEISADTRDDRVAFRDGGRYVARLRQLHLPPEPSATLAVALELDTRGMLETLSLRTAPRRAPGPGEVELRIEAAGLNFRDVLTALGMYEGPGGPLGSECVGTVIARGNGVTLEVGQRVMGMCAGAFRSHLTVAAHDVAPVPAGLSPHDAATLPIVFLTAMYSLERLAQLRRGERVLIHAGAGGVGLAAVQVAQRLGAEVFATVGSEEKRRYLQSLGVAHVFNSRSTEFASQIKAATGGRGVDVALNSLNGDFIPATLSALAPNGRFVEIGKAGIWTAEQVAAVRSDVVYHTLYLGDVPPETLQVLYTDLAAGLARGELRPLRHKTFAITEAEAAFRFMAQARHIGKVVLDIGNARDVQIRSDATYVVTGAFGGVGRQIARWLVDQGARHLLLIGRTGAATAAGTELVAELTAKGAAVHAAAIDVGDADALAETFASVDRSAPVRGVVHAAGVLDDGVLAQMNVDRFRTVFHPKVTGAWRLHEQTSTLALDFFVLFSSMVTVLGAPGQGNYAAANGVLDALAAYRRARGLPATAINWGPWAEAGMAAKASPQDRQRWQHQGISMIGTRQGLALFGRLLRGAPAQIAVLPVQWRVLLQQTAAGALPPFFDDLARQYASHSNTSGSAVDLKVELQQAPAARRQQIVIGRVSGLAHKVLGLDVSTPFDSQRPLQEYGLDSLMAVELRNGIGGLLGRTLPATLLFKYPTLHALAGFVLESVPLPAEEAPPPSTAAIEADVAAVGALSDDDVRRLLAEELEALSPGAFGES